MIEKDDPRQARAEAIALLIVETSPQMFAGSLELGAGYVLQTLQRHYVHIDDVLHSLHFELAGGAFKKLLASP